MTLKQEWTKRRCFMAYGRLIGLHNNLRNFTAQDVITTSEKVALLSVAATLAKIISSFNSTTSKTLSFEHYCTVKKIGNKNNVETKS